MYTYRRHRTGSKVIVVISIILVFVITAGVIGAAGYYDVKRNLDLGEKHLKNRNYIEAAEAFNRVIRIDSSNENALIGLGKAYTELDRFSEGAKILGRAISIGSTRIDLYKAVVALYEKQGKWSEILQVLTCGIEKTNSKALRDMMDELFPKAPEASLKSGKYIDITKVELKKNSNEDLLYYTTDGSCPDKGSSPYTQPIELHEGKNTIKAAALNRKGAMGPASEYEYEIILRPVPPEANISSGTYSSGINVELKSATANSRIFYTTNGTKPTKSSTWYVAPIKIESGSHKISAVTVSKDGIESKVSEFSYLINSQGQEQKGDSDEKVNKVERSLTCEISSPLWDAVFVKGKTIDISASARAENTVCTSSSIYLNEKKIAWSKNGKCSIKLNTAGLNPGIYKIRYSAASKQGLKASKTVQISIIDKPVVNISQPIQGAVLIKRTPAAVEASSKVVNSTVKKMELFIDNTRLTTVYTGKMRYMLKPENYKSGTYTLKVVAYAANGLSSSKTVKVRIIDRPKVDVKLSAVKAVYVRGQDIKLTAFSSVEGAEITSVSAALGHFDCDAHKDTLKGVVPTDNLRAGTYRINIEARASNGLIGYSSIQVVILDKTPKKK